MERVDPFASNWGFVVVFDWLLEAGLSLSLAYTYGVLARYRGRGEDRECYPSVSTLARVLGVNQRDLRRRLAELEARGFIVRLSRPGATNLYEFPKPSSGLTLQEGGPQGQPGVPHPGAPGETDPGLPGECVPDNKTSQITDKRLSARRAGDEAQSRAETASLTPSARTQRVETLQAELAKAETTGDAPRQSLLRKQLKELKDLKSGGRHA